MCKEDLEELREKAQKVLVELDKTVRKVVGWETVDIIGQFAIKVRTTNDKDYLKERIKQWEALILMFKSF